MKTEWMTDVQIDKDSGEISLREVPVDNELQFFYHYKDGKKFCCECVYTFTQNKKKYTVHGFSICSESQNFNKQIGRDIALGRALRLGGLIQSDCGFGYITDYIEKQKVRDWFPIPTKENLLYFTCNLKQQYKVYYTVEEDNEG